MTNRNGVWIFENERWSCFACAPDWMDQLVVAHFANKQNPTGTPFDWRVHGEPSACPLIDGKRNWLLMC